MAKKLGELAVGEQGVVARIGGEGALHRRLLDMGFTPGTRVKLNQIAPMGDPLEIHLRGYSLTLRRADAMTIELREQAAQTP